jgi:hypothetical protein
MKKICLLSLMLLVAGLTFVNPSHAQRNEWVNQVVVVNSGKYESTPPYLDYVSVQSYNPTTQVTTTVDNIYTQTAQHVVIKGNIAYVAAQDSIIMYNIDTWQRLNAIADSGLSRLMVFNDKLIVSKQYPIKRFFLEVLNASNLALLARVQNISGDCAGMTYDKDTIYVAVTGGFAASEGKMAAIATDTWTVGREINFGSAANGIWDLLSYNGNIFAVCGSPWVTPSQGCITVYNLASRTYVNKQFTRHFGSAYGNKDNLLYMKINDGIGSFNLLTFNIEDPSIIPDPGAPTININSAAVDYVNSYLYMNIGNRPPSFGLGVVANLAGDSLTSYTTGINAETIAIDYRTPVGIGPVHTGDMSVSIYPNPVAALMAVSCNSGITDLKVTDLTGRVILHQFPAGETTVKLDCSNIPGGVYFLTVTSPQGTQTRKFIRQ